MAERIKLPSEPTGRPEDQLRQLYNYLYEMARTLNININEYGDAALTDEEQQLMNQLTMDKTTSQTDETVPPGYNYQEQQTLKSLIIKTADFVKTQIDNYRIVLFGETEASGDFGQYRQKKGVKVDVTPDGVKQTYSFEEVIKGTKKFEINSKNYIKTGYLRTENSLPVYGVAIGKDIVTFEEDGTETYNDSNKVAELTADELSFYHNGTIMAKYSGTKTSFYSGGTEVMYIQGGKIYATNDLIISSGGKLQIGDWNISKSGLHGVTEEIIQNPSGVVKHDIYIGSFAKEDIAGNYASIIRSVSNGIIFSDVYTRNTVLREKEMTFILEQDPWNEGVIGGQPTGVLHVDMVGSILSPVDGAFDDLHYYNLRSASSREKKKNIEKIPEPGNQLDLLEPVSFIYKDDEKERTHHGLIYENTVGIMPEICSRENEPKSISYIELVPILLKEIQELRKRVKALEERED